MMLPGRVLRRTRTALFAGIAATAVAAAPLPAVAAAATAPFGVLSTAVARAPGARITGWAIDPNTTGAIPIAVSIDGVASTRTTAARTVPGLGAAHPGYGDRHGFAVTYAVPAGTHRICVSAVNVGAGSGATLLGCQTLVLSGSPAGYWDSATAQVGRARMVGWSLDPERSGPTAVAVTVDGRALALTVHITSRPDVPRYFPNAGIQRGYTIYVPLSSGVHRVCLTALNVGPGLDHPMGCRSVTPATAPSAPRSVAATGSYLSARVTWVAPASNGGATITRYTITASPGGAWTTAAGTSRAAMVNGLITGVGYRFTVRAVNAVGTSPASALSAAAAPVRTGILGVSAPPLISTSRYIRNINGAITDLAKMRSMGATDGFYNPAGHRYLVLLQIGGQTTTSIILTATSITVSYPQTVAAMKAYLDGYASTQQADAPVTVAVGTNNDVDVRATTGAIWARSIVNPLVGYAARYPAITVAGANDIEPGFIGSVSDTRGWLSGYLGATSARFVFNGSADGCTWTAAHGACNNGWSAAWLHWFSGGAAPTRIVSLPQIYNNTMSAQWKYISLTGVLNGRPKVRFAGPLTEWTACYPQNGGCGSLTNNSAWSSLWAQIRTDARIFQSSLPYGTDLRIN
ncbi:MAG: fibronectin type III domain-containing protein [bacterium]